MVERFDNVLAIIPARRESRRLPGKNKMKLSGGAALWQNTVNIARAAGIFNIVVSTDDNDILDMIGMNVLGLRRSHETSESNAATFDVIREVMQQVSRHMQKYDTICLLQPTSPLLQQTTLKHAIYQYYIKKHCALIAVNSLYNPCGAFYILNKDYFIQHEDIWIPGLAVYVVDEKEAIDIDHIWNFRIAEAVLKGNVISP